MFYDKFSLSCYLDTLDIENNVIVFDIDADKYDGHLPSNIEVIEHYAIIIDGKLLDVTASQFKGMPKVYFGEIPEWYAKGQKTH